MFSGLRLFSKLPKSIKNKSDCVLREKKERDQENKQVKKLGRLEKLAMVAKYIRKCIRGHKLPVKKIIHLRNYAIFVENISIFVAFFVFQIYNCLYFLMVFLSALLAIFHTIPELRSGDRDFNTDLNRTEIYAVLRINTNNRKEVDMGTKEFPLWMIILDLLLAGFFSVELFVRILICPNKKEFFRDWLNIMDVILFVAICIRFTIEQNPEWFLLSYDIVILYGVTYSVTVFRLFRFFRLARQFSGLYVLLLALRSSWKEFILLFCTVLLFALLFASCIFYAEYREPTTFPHMLSGLWWAIITLTTVGYGDHVPKSAGGQLIGSMCATCGIIVLAMPVAMIVANFNDYYQKNKDREKFKELYDFEQKRKLVTLDM